MISSLHGTAAHVADDSLVIVVGGVGFSVAVTAQLARTVHVGDDIHLHTNSSCARTPCRSTASRLAKS